MISIMTLTNIDNYRGAEAKLDPSSVASRLFVQALEPDSLGSNPHMATLKLSHGKSSRNQSSHLRSSSSLAV